MYVHINMGSHALTLQVMALLVCWYLTDKTLGKHNWGLYPHSTPLRQIAYRTVVAQIIIILIIIETSFAKRPLDIDQTALVTISI